MAKKLYRIKVPDTIATNDFNLSAGTSLVPKLNKKISFKLKSKTNKGITFEMMDITKGKDVAYPDGDSIQWQGTEYKLKEMTIFRGLYNDYTVAGVSGAVKDKAEVMLMFKNDEKADTVYVFFLLSKSSQTKSGFFDSFINQRNGKVGIPADSAYTDRNVSILDLMPNNSKHVHVFNDITRQMNFEYDVGTKPPDYSKSTVIIFSPSPGGYKNIPMEAGTIGCFFGFTEPEKKDNCNELLEKIKDASMNTIQLELGTNIICPPDQISGAVCNIGDQMKWNGDGLQSDDGSKKNVYLLTSTNRYSRLDNPFQYALSIGGIGSVLTSCYEVEVDMSGNELRQGEKHIPAYKDKYMIPQEYWFKSGEKLSAADMKKEEDKAKKFWFQAGEPGFIILMTLIGLAVFFLGFILFKEIQLKYLPPRIKAATGIEPSGPK